MKKRDSFLLISVDYLQLGLTANCSRIVLNSTHSGHHSKSNKDINLHIVHDSADEVRNSLFHIFDNCHQILFPFQAGRIAYTVSILLIFSLIIIVLMFRSIKRSSSTVEVSRNIQLKAYDRNIITMRL